MKTQSKTPVVPVNELSPEAIAHIIEQVQKLVDMAKPTVGNTEARNRRRGLKFRGGGEAVLPVLSNAVAQHEVAMIAAPMTKAMEERMRYAQLVKPAAALTKQLAELLADVERQATSDTWQIATTVYTFLRRVSVADPGVKTAIAEAVAFFRLGARDQSPTVASTTARAPEPAPVK